MRHTSERRAHPPRAPLRFDWSRAPIMIDGAFQTVYRARLGSYLGYAFKERGAWRWGIAFNGTTILDGIKGTLIDAKHRVENAYGPNGPRQMTISEATPDGQDDGDAPF